MILSIFEILFVVSPICSYTQYVALPDEVYDLRQHHHTQRSIGSAQHIPSINELQEAVKEVEAMIEANPSLPRLTRGEILDLLENITKSDELKNTTDRSPKAIMVVKAYTPENMEEYDMEDLYTKPPVTHIITKNSSTENIVDERNTSALNNLINTNPVEDNKLLTNKMKKFKGDFPKLSPTTITTTTTTTTIIPHFSPIAPNRASDFMENKQHHRRRPMINQLSTTTTYAPPVATYSSKNKRPLTRRPAVTNKYINHKYVDDVPKAIFPNEGLKLVEPPKFDIHTINEDMTIMKDNKEDTPVNPYTKRISDKVMGSTVANYVASSSVLPPIDIEVPGHLRDIVSEMDLRTALEEDPPYQPSVSTFTKLRDTEIQQHHPAFNFLPSSTSTITTSAMPDISNVVDNLSPEMQDLLASFGLIPNFQEQKAAPTSDSFNPIKAEVKPESYVGFKPLPNDDNSKSEMDELLARFGLGRSARNLKAKQKKMQITDHSELDIVPEEYQEVLGDMGFIGKDGMKIPINSLTKSVEKQHVFNPQVTKYATQEELEKLSRLVDVIKQLDNLNRTATDEDLKNIDIHDLKELVTSFDAGNTIVPLEQQNAPNPLNFESGQYKNEFKRQENITTTTTAVPTLEVKTTLVATTTEESRTPSIKDLEDSFGGQAEPVTQSIAPETTTPARKTGFYMLVDWNTFLDIDDQKGKRVNLRFQPTIGDPKRFYSVSVP